MVYYKNALEDFIRRLTEKSEDYYDRIAQELGFRRYDFWLWDNRAKIYIYDDAKSYQDATGQPVWSVGCALAGEKTIHSYPYAEGFFETTLPHEMGHIIFREFVGFNNHAIPTWLEEGVASYQETSRRETASKIVEEAMKNGNFINLQRLATLNPQFMPDRGLVNLFYAESLSIVDYLIKNFGSDSFVTFCQALRDKKDFARALSSSYNFSNVRELDEAWLKYIERN